jgi:uncharacterized membrane protein
MKSLSLKCPQCGANLQTNSNQCEFCGTNVKLSEDKQQFVGTGISCPKCSSENQIEDKHCGHCGSDLISVCPIPNCLEKNYVLRKFCKKCGCNLAETHFNLVQEEYNKYEKQIEYHQNEINKIEKRLPESKSRETIVKFFISVIGGIIALLFLSEGWWVGTIITILITFGIIAGYKSSEEYNLRASIAVHQDDLERMIRKNEINFSVLNRLNSE